MDEGKEGMVGLVVCLSVCLFFPFFFFLFFPTLKKVVGYSK